MKFKKAVPSALGLIRPLSINNDSSLTYLRCYCYMGETKLYTWICPVLPFSNEGGEQGIAFMIFLIISNTGLYSFSRLVVLYLSVIWSVTHQYLPLHLIHEYQTCIWIQNNKKINDKKQ